MIKDYTHVLSYVGSQSEHKFISYTQSIFPSKVSLKTEAILNNLHLTIEYVIICLYFTFISEKAKKLFNR